MELQFENIGKTYRSRTALSDISVTLREGVYALLGPNGAGKSTWMNILAGLLKPDSGKITLDGKEISAMGKEFRRILGYLPQEPGFYPDFTGYALMKYFAEIKDVKAAEPKIGELLEFVNLSGDADRRYREYSGGMKRRLGIAVTLLNDPKILILDEPTAGLDPKERIRFRNIISSIGRNRIIIFATHIVSDIETIADQAILLKSGKIVLFGPIRSVLDSVRGRVWTLEADAREAEKYVMQHPNATIVKSGEHWNLRIVSGARPQGPAVEAKPCLEDVYMYWFEEHSLEGKENETVSL